MKFAEPLHEFEGEPLHLIELRQLPRERELVHVELAAELDLDRVDVLLGPPVVTRRKATAIGLIVRDAQPSFPTEPVERVDDDASGRGAPAAARDDVGALTAGVLMTVTASARHGVGTEEYGKAEARDALVEKLTQRRVIGPVVRGQSALEFGWGERPGERSTTLRRDAPDEPVRRVPALCAFHREGVDVRFCAIQIDDVAAAPRDE